MQFLLVIPLLAVGQFKPAPTPLQLFWEMESKVVTAKSLKVVTKSVVEGAREATAEMTLYLGEGNRLRLESAFVLDKKKPDLSQVISDGRRVAVTRTTLAAADPRTTPKDFHAQALGFLLRTASGTLVDELTRPGSQTPLEDLAISEFKLGAKEQIGKKSAQIVEYELAVKGVPELLKCKIWIDVESSLPLKRTLELGPKGSKYRYTETFVEFVINPTVDSKLFDLPK